jgi:CheY-like chemotaxis protein
MPLIVIVDDRATNRTIYSKLAMTIGEGVKARAFDDPTEALNWLARNRPDLIVTDYDMPQMDGEEFISRFRNLPHSAGVPIMMITVCDQRKLRLRALESGATDFLNTPIDHCEFLMRARNLLKLSQDAETRAEGGKAGAPPPSPGDFFPETRQFLALCETAGAYALHVVALDEADGKPVDPERVAARLQKRLRGGDVLARIDHSRFAVLQKNIVDPADAQACARRLSSLRVAADLHVGTALPQSGGAEACLSAAVDLAQRRDAPAEARLTSLAEVRQRRAPLSFLPRINLLTGAIIGAQLLCGDAPAEIGDMEMLSYVIACLASLRLPPRPAARFSLRLPFAGSGPAPAGQRLAPVLSKARVSPSRLDLQICAQQALVDPARAEGEARALKALGASVTLDLSALGPHDLRAGDQWAALLGDYIHAWCDAILVPCGESRAVAAARLLRGLIARRAGHVPQLIADNVRLAENLEPLRQAGASQAQGACFGAPFSARDLKALFNAQARAEIAHAAARRA